MARLINGQNGLSFVLFDPIEGPMEKSRNHLKPIRVQQKNKGGCRASAIRPKKAYNSLIQIFRKLMASLGSP